MKKAKGNFYKFSAEHLRTVQISSFSVHYRQFKNTPHKNYRTPQYANMCWSNNTKT
jgi:hypothetical protein